MKHCDHCGEPDAQSYSVEGRRESRGENRGYCGVDVRGDLCAKCLDRLKAVLMKFFSQMALKNN